MTLELFSKRHIQLQLAHWVQEKYLFPIPCRFNNGLNEYLFEPLFEPLKFNQFDVNGLKHGLWKGLYPDGQLWREYNYVNFTTCVILHNIYCAPQ